MEFKRTEGGILVAEGPSIADLGRAVDENFTQLENKSLFGLRKEKTIYVPNQHAPQKELSGLKKAAAVALAAFYIGGCATPRLISSTQASGKPAVTASAKPKKEETVKFGYNALETGFTSDRDVRNRVFTNIDLIVAPVRVGYHGLNEMVNLDTETYFGNHRFFAGENGSNITSCVMVKTNSTGGTDVKAGIRDKNLIKMLGAYGYIDLVADMDAARMELFAGKELGKRFALELFHAIERPYEGQAEHYTELQMNFDIGKGWYIIDHFNFPALKPREGTNMVGITKKIEF